MLFAATTQCWLLFFSSLILNVSRTLVASTEFCLLSFVLIFLFSRTSKKLGMSDWTIGDSGDFFTLIDERDFSFQTTTALVFSTLTGVTCVILLGVLFRPKEWVRPNSFVFNSSQNDVSF